MKIKRWAAGAAAALLAVTMFHMPVHADKEGNEDFDAFLTEKFKEMMESDYMTLHYQIRDYKAYGIEKPEVNIGRYSQEDYEKDKKKSQDALAELEKFDYDSLSASQQHDNDTYKYALENDIAINSYPDFDFCYLPGEGLINNLLTNFTEYKFYNKEDVEDYLTALESTPDFIDDTLTITKDQASRGFFMTDSALDETLDQIRKFAEKKDDNELIVTFENCLDEMDFLTDAEKETYKQRNRDIVLNTYIPCYEECGKELEKLRGSRKGDGGLATMDGGEEYFRAFLRVKGSTDDTAEEMLDVCTEYIQYEIDNYLDVYMHGTEEDDEGLQSIEIEDPVEVLKFLQDKMKATYPEGPEVTYKATYLDPSVANDSIVAYYVNPPLDDLKDNVIKINGDNVGDTDELYTTLAHEGFPGHLYQITWYLDTKPNPLRTAISTTGYTEGWGMYSELRAGEFSGLAKSVYTVNNVNVGAGYAMNAAADIGVNALGWDVPELEEYLGKIGLDKSNAQPLFDFVTENPGVIVPYGYGIARFALFRKEAMETLGDAFDEKEFHNVLLTYGDRPFEIVEKDLKAYYESKKQGTTPSDDKKDGKEDTPAAPADKKSSNYVVPALIACAVLLAAVIFAALRRKKKDTF